MKRGKRRPGVGDDAERRLQDAGDLGRVDVDADELEVGVDAPAHLRLMQPSADRQHDIGLAPQLVAGERRLGEVVAVADATLAAGIADHRRFEHFGNREYLLGRADGAPADKEQRFPCVG